MGIAQLITSVQTANLGRGGSDRTHRLAHAGDRLLRRCRRQLEERNAATAEISQNVTGAADGTKLVVSVLNKVAGAATDTLQSAESVLWALQAVEAAAAELRREVEGFLASLRGVNPRPHLRGFFRPLKIGTRGNSFAAFARTVG